jgi:hypothetical protein
MMTWIKNLKPLSLLLAGCALLGLGAALLVPGAWKLVVAGGVMAGVAMVLACDDLDWS